MARNATVKVKRTGLGCRKTSCDLTVGGHGAMNTKVVGIEAVGIKIVVIQREGYGLAYLEVDFVLAKAHILGSEVDGSGQA